MKVDFLIVGQGLAGSLLGFELIRRGFKIAIMDSGDENASQVAAGLINPMAGRYLAKSAEVDVLLPAAQAYYRELERFFGQTFYIEKPMLRLLKNEMQLKQARKRLNNPDYAPYVGRFDEQVPQVSETSGILGKLEQKQTGYLLTRPLLETLKNFFINHQCYQQYRIDYQDIKFTEGASYQQIDARWLVFCEGYKATGNPWFSYLPFRPVKGEILTLRHQNTLPDRLLNYGHWMIPLDEQLLRTGATFDNHNIDTRPSEQARQLLLDSLQTILPDMVQAELVTQQANVRPATSDKRPFIGQHPEYPQLAIFNGFGAKGSLQIPYYCQQFADFMSEKQALSASVDIRRVKIENSLGH